MFPVRRLPTVSILLSTKGLVGFYTYTLRGFGCAMPKIHVVDEENEREKEGGSSYGTDT